MPAATAPAAEAPGVLITGCSSGIGRATALAAVRAGLPTWAAARRPEESLGELAAAGCRILRLDVTDEQSRLEAVRAVEEVHGAVGALVNNAGYSQIGPVEEVPLGELRPDIAPELMLALFSALIETGLTLAAQIGAEQAAAVVSGLFLDGAGARA